MAKTINEIALEILQQHPEGLDREELTQLVSLQNGKPIKEASLRLGELGLSGKVRSQKQARQVTVTKEVDVYFAAAPAEAQAVVTPTVEADAEEVDPAYS